MKLLLYLLRWQASTPILGVVTYLLVDQMGSIATAAIANVIGGLMFYRIDKLIFKDRNDRQDTTGVEGAGSGNASSPASSCSTR